MSLLFDNEKVLQQQERKGLPEADSYGILAATFKAELSTLPGRPDLPDLPYRFESYICVCLREESEFGHLALWVPVLVGAGAVLNFRLLSDIATLPAATIWVAMLLALLVIRASRTMLRSIAAAIIAVASGFIAANWEIGRHSTIILDSPVTTTVSGRVLSREIDGAGRWRYRLLVIGTEAPELKRQPEYARITTLSGTAPFLRNDIIEGRARLSPPSGPALVGSNDFSFDAYMDDIGAYGYFYGSPRRTGRADDESLGEKAATLLETVQKRISGRIKAILPGDTGAFAASMVTDDRRAISKETTEALRKAGLTHVVAISGLNMALAAGLFFVTLRMLLGFSQSLSNRFPVKKLAAGGALFTVTGYYLISGFSVSAERAYIMMALILCATLVDRAAISLRNIALSATIITLLSPSAVLNPGFQMSYAATLGLVVAYSRWQARGSGSKRFQKFRFVAPVLKFLHGIFATSLIGGLSTALFSLEHFNRLSTWGLPANLLAMPIISLVVMPVAILALLLMPFGLDWLPLLVMGLGLDQVLAIARWAAERSDDIVSGRLPDSFFVLMVLSLLAAALFRSALKFTSILLAACALGSLLLYWGALRPDLVVFENGSLAGYVTGNDIAVSEANAQSFITDQWRYGLRLHDVLPPVLLKLPKGNEAAAREALDAALASGERRRFTCAPKRWCALRMQDNRIIVIVYDAAILIKACERADIVVTPLRKDPEDCASKTTLLSAGQLRRTGTVEIRFNRSGLETATALSGHLRPWNTYRYFDWRSNSFRFPAPDQPPD